MNVASDRVFWHQGSCQCSYCPIEVKSWQKLKLCQRKTDIKSMSSIIWFTNSEVQFLVPLCSYYDAHLSVIYKYWPSLKFSCSVVDNASMSLFTLETHRYILVKNTISALTQMDFVIMNMWSVEPMWNYYLCIRCTRRDNIDAYSIYWWRPPFLRNSTSADAEINHSCFKYRNTDILKMCASVHNEELSNINILL
jgi:hypothetical protein